jgi:hypothetical protein
VLVAPTLIFFSRMSRSGGGVAFMSGGGVALDTYLVKRCESLRTTGLQGRQF